MTGAAGGSAAEWSGGGFGGYAAAGEEVWRAVLTAGEGDRCPGWPGCVLGDEAVASGCRPGGVRTLAPAPLRRRPSRRGLVVIVNRASSWVSSRTRSIAMPAPSYR